ncbi:MAG: ABC transporter permease, partial [Gammaproteobacteria bacterium]|nr:ABC transporter permease [Gammaproteobacteria bacterium]
GEGAKQRLAGEINALGANRLAVWPNVKEFPRAKLPFDDAQAIVENVENVAAVLPELRGTATVRIGNVDYESNITATSAEFPVVRDWPLASGVFFDHHDSESHAPVAVLGATALEHLFADGGNPLGEYVLIKNVPFLVIGTMTQKGASGFGSNDQDDVVFVPLKTGARRLFGKTSLRALTVTVTDSSRIDRTETQLRLLLTELHGEEDFNVLNSTEMQETMAEAMSIATLILGAIGAISLLVGGIGIMNIMLVSVIERTREIGIRVATGARRSDILVQFLVEAMVVSGVGGLIGIGLGIAIGLFISLLFSEVDVTFTGLPMIVAFGCAAATGLVFGFMPARNAARLDPVVALASD